MSDRNEFLYWTILIRNWTSSSGVKKHYDVGLSVSIIAGLSAMARWKQQDLSGF